MGSRATEKVTGLLVATIALWTQSPDAQTIRLPDFREKPPIANRAPDGPCPECGVVRSIREIHKRRDDSLQRTATAGSASAFDTRVVGALVVLPFGPGSADKSASVGGVGTSEMNERFGQRGQPLVRDRFPVERMVDELDALYQQLAQRYLTGAAPASRPIR